MTTGAAILTALGALLVLIGGAAAFDWWVRRTPERYEQWLATLGCPGCGTDRCTCEDAEEWL